MHTIRIERHGGPDVLELTETDTPDPGRGQVVIEVAAAGVNYVDVYRREGLYPGPLPTVLGSEGAGVVTSVGEGVTEVGEGARVGWVGVQGSYATHVVATPDQLVVVPDTVELDLAAAVMLQGCTAHYLSASTYPLDESDTALVYAAAGGVGRLLVQLAKRRGARVLACTSTPEKANEVRRLGADEVILYRDVDIAATVADLTGGHGVDVVYDSVGADTFTASLACLRPRGTMVLFGQASGPVGPIDPQVLARSGSLYLTRPTLGDYAATHSELDWRATAVLGLVATGSLDVAVHGVYPLADAGRAHTDLESGATVGKLLLRGS